MTEAPDPAAPERPPLRRVLWTAARRILLFGLLLPGALSGIVIALATVAHDPALAYRGFTVRRTIERLDQPDIVVFELFREGGPVIETRLALASEWEQFHPANQPAQLILKGRHTLEPRWLDTRTLAVRLPPGAAVIRRDQPALPGYRIEYE